MAESPEEIFGYFPEITDPAAVTGRSSREAYMLLEVLSGSADPKLVNAKPGEPSFCLYEALYGIGKCTGSTWQNGRVPLRGRRTPNTESLEGR